MDFGPCYSCAEMVDRKFAAVTKTTLSNAASIRCCGVNILLWSPTTYKYIICSRLMICKSYVQTRGCNRSVLFQSARSCWCFNDFRLKLVCSRNCRKRTEHAQHNIVYKIRLRLGKQYIGKIGPRTIARAVRIAPTVYV